MTLYSPGSSVVLLSISSIARVAILCIHNLEKEAEAEARAEGSRKKSRKVPVIM
jgi:hypothetical protein